jgi:small subunit ribosomal protein S6
MEIKMETEQKNLYEGMFVIAANLSDEARRLAVEKIKAMIAQSGGEIVKEHDMGRKRLAYEIKRHKEGYYTLLYFNLAPSEMKALWKEWRLMEDLLRFLTLKVDHVLEKIEFKALVEQ